MILAKQRAPSWLAAVITQKSRFFWRPLQFSARHEVVAAGISYIAAAFSFDYFKTGRFHVLSRSQASPEDIFDGRYGLLSR